MKKETNMICATHIAQLRDKLNLKQSELAAVVSEMTGRKKPYTVSIVSAWETGRRPPSADAAQAMAELFNTPVEYILGETNISSEEKRQSNTVMLADDKLSFEDLSEYHGIAVFVTFPQLEHEDTWAVVDCSSPKKITLYTVYGPLDLTKNNYPYNIYSPESLYIERLTNKKKNRLGITQVIESKKPVYVEMQTSDSAIRAFYDGWYMITKDTNFLQSDTGKVLPITGIGISYDCYYNK